MISKILENLPKARTAKSSRLVKLASALEKVYSRSIDQLRDDLRQRWKCSQAKRFVSSPPKVNIQAYVLMATMV
jgi:hypothetical protein